MKKTAVVFLCLFFSALLKAEPEEENIPGLPPTPKPQDQRILPPAKTASEYSKLCIQQDVVGFWKVMKWTPYFHVSAKDWKKPAFMKFQWFIFSAEGQIKTLSAGKEFKISEVSKKLAGAKTPLRFNIEKNGIMKVTSSKKKEIDERWRCAVVTQNITEKEMGIALQKGDLIQSLIDNNNKILYIRQMRKIQQSEK